MIPTAHSRAEEEKVKSGTVREIPVSHQMKKKLWEIPAGEMLLPPYRFYADQTIEKDVCIIEIAKLVIG